MTTADVVVLAVFLLPVAFAAVGMVRRRQAQRREGLTVLANALVRADLFALQGAWPACLELAQPAAAALARRNDPAALELAARARMLIAECEAGLDHREVAIRELAAAAALRARLPAGEAATKLAAWERMFLAGLGRSDREAEQEWPDPDQVLAEADHERDVDPARAIRLARLALWRAEALIREGSWPRAKSHLEQAVGFGERVPAESAPDATGAARERDQLHGALARSRASAAAIEIAQVLASLGRHDEAISWFDRAVAVCEDAPLPPGKIARSRALIMRAMHEPADAVLGFEPRRRRLVEARTVAEASDWPAARALAGRAEVQLGVLAAHEGDAEKARGHFLEAQRRVEGLALPGVAELVAESRLLLAHVLEDHGDLEAARSEYRRALDAGREDADPDARRLAAIAGCHLHRLLHHADRADEARALLEPLEALAPTLDPAARPLVAAMVARCRGQQQFRDGDRESADRTLGTAMTLVEAAGGPEAADLSRQISTERGHLALASEQPVDAEAHFRRALATAAGARPDAVEQAERAEVRLRLAQSLLQQERPADALPELRRAFEGGRDSGRAAGRAVAAAAALTLGDNPEQSLAERRAWYESAARFGRLSGTPRGRQVEEAVAERLRELTE